MDSPTARMATQKYRKPEVFELGAVHELTCWEKSGGSADAWGQMKQEGHPGTDGGTSGDFSGGH